MHKGIVRPLLLSTAVIGLFTVGVVGWYWDTFALMWENMTTMGEGHQIAAQMRGPDELLAFAEAYPERVSLVAFDVDAPEEGIRYGGDSSRAVVGLTRLLVLAEYAREVEAGRIDPDARLPLDEVSALVLPGAGGGQHARTRSALLTSGAVDGDSTVAIQQVADAMMRWNDQAATDLLVQRLDRDAVSSLRTRLGFPRLDPPVPQSGLYLSWNHHGQTTPPEERLGEIEALGQEAYLRRVDALAQAYRHDEGFRQRERGRLERRGTDLSLQQQRALAQATFPRGTAAGYARFVGQALTDSLCSSAVSRRMLRFLDRPVPDSVGVTLDVIGSAGGSFPGLISVVGYAHRAGGASPRVVALLMEDVPISVFYHLLQTGIDKGLVVQLLGDDAFFDRVRQRLNASPA